MACVPCILIPFFLLIWRFIQPFVLRFWNPFGKKGEGDKNAPKDITECSMFASCPCLKKNEESDTAKTTTEEVVDVKKMD